MKCCSVVFGLALRLLVIQFVVVSRHQQNPPLLQRLVSSTRRGPSQLSVLHLPLERFTAGEGAKYWLRIAISAYPTCMRRPCREGGSRRNTAMARCTGKNTTVWLPDGEKPLTMDAVTRFRRIQERDRQTDSHCMTASYARHRPSLCIASRGKN